MPASKVSIFMDAQVAMAKIRQDDDGPGQGLAREIRKLEKELSATTNLEYNWVPGHEGIEGNEKADQMAKEGAEGDGDIYLYPATDTWSDEIVTLANLHRKTTERAAQVARQSVMILLRNHEAMRLKRSLGMRKAFKQQDGKAPPPKRHVAAFVQMACGHALTGSYLHRFNMRESPGCWWCNKSDKQTRGHLFGRCTRFKKEFADFVTAVNEIRRDKKKDKWKEGMVRQLFEEEGYELVIIEYMKKTGIGYRVEPEEKASTCHTG